MADYIFDDEVPNLTGFDGTWHTFAVVADLAVDANLIGGRARFPAVVPDENFVWVVFDADQNIVAQVDLTALVGPVPNAWNEFTSAAFVPPGDVALTAGEYRSGFATNGDFVYSNTSAFPIEHSEIITAASAAFHNGGSGPVWPEEETTSFLFFADMLVEEPAPPPPPDEDDTSAPGTHTASGTSSELTAAGSSAVLTVSGSAATLTASGNP